MKIRVVIERGLATVYSDCEQADVEVIDRDVQDEDSERMTDESFAQVEDAVKKGQLELGYSPADLENLPTIHQGQCCDCKIDSGGVRVWLCRVAGGITVENYLNGRWITVAGDCSNTGGEL